MIIADRLTARERRLGASVSTIRPRRHKSGAFRLDYFTRPTPEGGPPGLLTRLQGGIVWGNVSLAFTRRAKESMAGFLMVE